MPVTGRRGRRGSGTLEIAARAGGGGGRSGRRGGPGPAAGRTTGHDEVFTVNCPPYASLYAGDDQGRLAAFWATAGLDPPAEPDHLAVLLDGYAGLGEAGKDDARRVLFGEFVWPWLPAYLGAVSDLPPGPLTGWAELTLDALRAGTARLLRGIDALRRADEPRGVRESGGAHGARNAQEGV